MANANDVQGSAPTAKRGGGGKMMVGLITLLLLGGGGTFAWLHAHDAKRAKVAVKAPDLYLPLVPAFVVNFQDQDSTRYLQVGVTLMTHDAAAVQVLKDNDPVIRNALVMLFSSQDYTILSDAAGKQKLQAEALASVRKIVEQRLGRPGIEALYFTSFVMQ